MLAGWGLAQYSSASQDSPAGRTDCWHKQQEATGKDKPYWQRLRTAGLKEKVRQQVQRADLEELLRLATSAAGQECLKALLDRICDDPEAPAA